MSSAWKASCSTRPYPTRPEPTSTSRIATYAPEALDHFVRENPRMTQSILTSTLDQLVQTTDNLVQEEEPFGLEEARVEFYADGDTVIAEGTPESDLFRLVSTQGGLKVSRAGMEVCPH